MVFTWHSSSGNHLHSAHSKGKSTTKYNIVLDTTKVYNNDYANQMTAKNYLFYENATVVSLMRWNYNNNT